MTQEERVQIRKEFWEHLQPILPALMKFDPWEYQERILREHREQCEFCRLFFQKEVERL